MEDLSPLRELEKDVMERFNATQRVMSFDEYFAYFTSNPGTELRTAAQYMRDCMDHYGSTELEQPEGHVVRYRIFDCPWDDGRDRLVGQEVAQQFFYGALNNFVREGRVTRLVLFHGPNGSAKSSFIRCLARGLEDFSEKDEGAIYRFSWVFPSGKLAKKKLGFGEGEEPVSVESYAHIDESDMDARIPGDLSDHPLLLIPKERRRGFIEDLRERGVLGRDVQISDYFLEGDLSPRSRAIADSLLTAYHGDFQRVLQHIQVQRFFFSRRYRVGVVTIEPQMHVDASIRQLTADEGLASLPASLRHLELHEPFGDLVEANRGIIEYNDLLKKPVESYKYLLATCEKGTVALPSAILHLDVLFLASSNEKHLNAFKEYQDFTSFKGRMDLIKMPYLRNHRIERKIYWQSLVGNGLSHRVAPHSTYVAALFAVLTRLRRPDPELYPETVREALTNMTALEKADLYAGERDPTGLAPEIAREVRACLVTMLQESQDDPDYEGSFGASPREMKQLMLNALQDEHSEGLSPIGVIAEIRSLLKLKSVYEWLQIEPNRGYHDVDAFIEQVHDRWLARVDDEVRSAMGLVNEAQYVELFSRYILHVSYTVKGERLYNELTGRTEDPDPNLMSELEQIWSVENPQEHRMELISRVGAWRVDHPGAEIDYRRLFPELFHRMEEDYYTKQRDTLATKTLDVLKLLDELEGADVEATESHLSAQDRGHAREAIDTLESDYGYQRWAIRECLGSLLRQRYLS
jgi:serine protein kinase